ncbi:hypothetical protein TYRP_006963 [Tyrophagus putrescentiae]|nr:hypothetical protein TYRP_006963 [Tyrophagus putrescentiae]
MTASALADYQQQQQQFLRRRLVGGGGHHQPIDIHRKRFPLAGRRRICYHLRIGTVAVFSVGHVSLAWLPTGELLRSFELTDFIQRFSVNRRVTVIV